MPVRTKSIKVLVDDEEVLLLVGAVLERDRYQVVLARDGEQALAAAAEQAPDVVVLDLSLPAFSGLEVCRRLATWFEGPILILSGHDDEDVVVEALDLGADDYLTKPFRPRELQARVRALVRRPQQIISVQGCVAVRRAADRLRLAARFSERPRDSLDTNRSRHSRLPGSET